MVSDHDLDLLDSLLDGELSLEEEQSLRARLASDAALAQALEQVRSERAARQAVWSVGEPSDAEVNALVSSIRRQLQRDEVWTRRLRALRYVSGLAACILLGFIIGRFVPWGTTSNARDNGIVYEPGRGPVMEVSDEGDAPRSSGFRVLLTDDLGRVVAEQRFDTFSEAREFTEDLSRAATRSRTVRPVPAQPHVQQPFPLAPQQPVQRANDTFLIKGEF